MSSHLVLASTVDDERRQLVRESLQAHNTSACPDMQSWEQPGHLDVYLLDEQGNLAGGLVATGPLADALSRTAVDRRGLPQAGLGTGHARVGRGRGA